MDTVSQLVFRHGPPASLVAWVAFGWFALVLLAFAALTIAGLDQPLVPDPRLAPFRWEVLNAGLA